MRELDRVIGYDSVKEELYKILDVLKNPDRYEKMGVKKPHGILFDGEPGIGKTLMAECFIKESERKVYIIRKDKPNGDFVNHIRTTFEEALKNTPSIIFLDDMDKFANEDRFHRDAEEYVTVQTCIDEARNKDIYVVATTNDSSSLPSSLTRNGRFDKIFYLDFPTNEDAKKIIDFYLADKNLDDNIDIEEISRFCRGYSCADLEKILNEAGLYAAYDGKKRISQEYIIDACLRSIYDASNDTSISVKEIERRAIHEAGHALIAEVFNPGSVDFISIAVTSNGNSKVGGLVSRNNEDRHHSFEDEEHEIMIALGGKAAIEIVLGEADTGCNKDLRSAYGKTMTLMDNISAYDFSSWCHGEETSQNTFEHLDSAVSVEMSRYYKMTKKLLVDNRNYLNGLIENIIKYKTISYKKILAIRESAKI